MLTPKEEQANVQNGFEALATVSGVAWRDGALENTMDLRYTRIVSPHRSMGPFVRRA
jgi:hypothetical protein